MVICLFRNYPLKKAKGKSTYSDYVDYVFRLG